ncbi:hypothetical protein AVEN_65961-1 [Araneus ventricosus]|uniref:Peptidase aspartic putative domain-containing protein n=1 Tax=Araneus ventricosus TaxID=182803 RepID=A0A4Y2LCX1_ARAVE|nr:hypothetical protein AVEN_65961-1 [Araneus ventricosus]
MKIPQRIIYDVVDVRIQSLENPRNSLQFEALVTDTITGSQINFAHKVTRSSLEKRGIRLADRESVRDLQILAGGEIFWVLQPQRIEKINKHLFLTQTLFGYTVQGVTRSPREGESIPEVRDQLPEACSCGLDERLKSFFQLESLGIYDSGVSDNREGLINDAAL